MHDLENLPAEPNFVANVNEFSVDDAPSRTLADVFYEWLSRYSLPVMGLLVLAAIAAAILSSWHKPLWYDEILTVILATQLTWHGFVQAMPPEGNPPLNSLLVMLCVHLLGLSEVAVRLPALLGFVGAMAGIFFFVRREAGGAIALMAVTLFLAEPVWSYAYEGRPYGLLMGMLMLTLVSYQSATRAAAQSPPRPRALALTGIVLGLLGSIFSHHIGTVEAGTPLLFGEVMRSWQRRRVDWPVAATGLVIIPALAITVPMIRRTNAAVVDYSRVFDWPLTLHKLQTYYAFATPSFRAVLDPAIFSLLLLGIVLLIRPAWPQLSGNAAGPYVAPAGKTPTYILSAIVGASLLIPITWIAMMQERGWYFCRYGIGTVLGIIILFSLRLHASRVRQSLLVTTACLFSLASWIPWAAASLHQSHDFVAERFVRDDTTGLTFVASQSDYYLPLWWYASPAQRPRVVMLYDDADPGLDDAVVLAERHSAAVNLVPYNGFLASHDHFLVVEMGWSPDVLLKNLERAGYRVTLVRREDDENKLYDVRRGHA